MKKILLISGLLMITSCYAIEIANKENFINESISHLSKESLELENKLDVRLPVTSKASAGKVIQHHVQVANFSYSIFIVGDDPISREWLKTHAHELEEKNALGFITNISSGSSLEELQNITTAPLLPADVDDLLAILHESHYPLIFHEGEIWQ